MDSTTKNFVHLPIDAVDTVVCDPQGHYDGEHYDRYATFVEARDAALSSIEIMLDEADYDGDDHREELERMQGLLEAAETFEDLASQPAHRRLLDRQAGARPVAA
ncbi:MAG: hypothetical protein ACYC61_14280 [Isosphaeraceae bacterium]